MTSCSWCGADVDEGDSWRAYEASGEREAGFCRLEHVVPWAMKGPDWSEVVLVHHRAEHRIAETFDSVDHMREWASAGGRWR
jgi:hypothetical protein